MLINLKTKKNTVLLFLVRKKESNVTLFAVKNRLHKLLFFENIYNYFIYKVIRLFSTNFFAATKLISSRL